METEEDILREIVAEEAPRSGSTREDDAAVDTHENLAGESSEREAPPAAAAELAEESTETLVANGQNNDLDAAPERDSVAEIASAPSLGASDITQVQNEPSSAAPEGAASTPKAPNKRSSKTLVGGLLASSKTMKPFRSPLMNRENGSTPMTSDTPAPKAGDSAIPSVSKASHASPLPSTSSYRGLARKSSHNKALNKPFVSPFVRNAGAGTAAASSAETVASASDTGMSAFQINTALPILERRLANLKNAKRYLKAIDQDLQTSDNTDHILELSAKWLAAGREAAEMLWDLTKDHVVEENDQTRDGFAFGSFGENGKRESWGWADPVAEYAKKAEEELASMSDEEREKVIKDLEAEDEKDPMPDTVEEVLSRASSRSSTSSKLGSKRTLSTTSKTSSGDGERPNKAARLENVSEGDERHYEDEQEEVHGTPEDPEPYSQEGDEEKEDDPHKRGMARMLLQCGIQMSTFGWDAAKEEWNEIEGE